MEMKRSENGKNVNFMILSTLKIEIQFPLNNLSLFWHIDSKLGVWVAYIKKQLGIATQVSVINVKVTVAKNRNSVFT
jgi:hypothetical protein